MKLKPLTKAIFSTLGRSIVYVTIISVSIIISIVISEFQLLTDIFSYIIVTTLSFLALWAIFENVKEKYLYYLKKDEKKKY